MKVLNLPHKDPIHFAKYIILQENTFAIVKVVFQSIPSLAMVVEAAAQSSAAFNVDNTNLAFLVAIKDVKLLHQLISTEYEIRITCEYRLDNVVYFYFEVFDKNIHFVSGSLTISLQ